MNKQTNDRMKAIIEEQMAKAAAKSKPFSGATGEKKQPASTNAQPQPKKPQDKPANNAQGKPEPGKVYSLLGAGGKIMQEIKRVSLPVGCLVYFVGNGDGMGATIEPEVNGKQLAVVFSDINPRYVYLDVRYMKPWGEKFGIGQYYDDNFKLARACDVNKYRAMVEAKNQPELSTVTVDSLLGTTPAKPAPQYCAPAVMELPAPKPAPAPAPAPAADPLPDTSNEIEVIQYSPKSFVLIGDGTRSIKDRLAAIGGKPNWNLTHPETRKRVFGWVFANNRMEDVKAILKK